jgi:phosphoglycerate dehydrogenase-like enzyme/predicted dehydrogenase
MHLPVLARLSRKGEVELAVICDIRRDRALAARTQFGFADEGGEAFAALERSDIDAVYIFGSAQLHHEYGLAALRAGKHLFVEKPIAPSYAKASELAETALALGLIAVGGHNRRFYKSLAAVRARAGKSGWRFAEAVFHKPESGKPAPFGARSWLTANGIHALDALVFMMGGLPERLTAFAGETDAREPSAFSAVMQWPDGAQAVFLCNNNAGARCEEYVFHGPGETCRVTDEDLAVEKDSVVVKTPFQSIGDGVAAEHDAFLHAIRGGSAPAHSIATIAPSLFLAELIERGYTGRVQLPRAHDPGPTPSRLASGRAIMVVQPGGLQQAIERWLPQFRLVTLEDIRRSPEQRNDVVAAILGHGSGPLPQDIVAKLPELAIVAVSGLSLARYEPQPLLARGIRIVNASEAYAESVAEFALGLAILGRRRAFASHEVMRAGGWGVRLAPRGFRGIVKRAGQRLRPALKAARLEPLILRAWRAAARPGGAVAAHALAARELRGANVGLIGWSANARAFTVRLVRAHAHVMVYSEHGSAADIRKAGATPGSLREALAADIVSLHRGLTKDTLHFLGASELAQLRPGAVLINAARGALIEPSALLARLRRGDVFACLDTYEEEPLDASHPLRRLQNVFLTSHIAGGSADMNAAAAEEVVRKVADYLSGDSVESISAERLRTMT